MKYMEAGTLSTLYVILSPVGVLTGSVDRLDLSKVVQGEGTKKVEKAKYKNKRNVKPSN